MPPDFDLRSDDSLLLVVDVQERFLQAIPAIGPDGEAGQAMRVLVEGCTLLAVPTLFSEQVPDKLGRTLPQLREAAPEATVLDKSAFSCGDDEELRRQLADSGRQQVVVCGIEAHICVLATVDDLLRRSYRVVVAGDAVASRRDDHRRQALEACRQLGALVAPVESILFRLQRQAGVGCFKALSRLVR